jgi:glutathionylspermidine synthase
VALPTKSAQSEKQLPEASTSRVDAPVTGAEASFDALVQEDPERARAAVDELRRLLTAREIFFGGGPLPTSLKPHFVPRAENDGWIQLLARALTIMEQTAEELRASKTFRREGPFSAEAWELLDIDPGYSKTAVVCRPDVVWERGRIGMLEMNADSPAMMLYADVIQDLQRSLYPLDRIDSGLLTFEYRIPVLLETLVSTYREWGGTSESPVIAIIDWPGQKTSSEQEQLARAFSKLGCPAFTCAPHELETRGGKLYGRGEPIDIVQRRLLFPEMVKRRAEVGPLVTAYRERFACVINPLRSYLIGCKAILAELCDRERQKRFTPEQIEVLQAILPCTVGPEAMTTDELQERIRWVLKPIFGSGGSGVVIGRYTDEATWEHALRVARQGNWVAQTFLPIPLYRVPLTSTAGFAMLPLYANWNPFFFGGRAAGGIARVSSDPVVGISARGALLPTVLVNE